MRRRQPSTSSRRLDLPRNLLTAEFGTNLRPTAHCSPMKATATTILVLASATLWGVRLVFGDSPWAPSSASVLAIWLVLAAALAIVGATFTAGRWAQNFAIALGTIQLAVATSSPIDFLWITALATTALTLAALTNGGLSQVVRRLPPPSGIPHSAIGLMVVLFGIPALAAAFRPNGLGWADWFAIGAAVTACRIYSQANWGAIWIVRVILPVLLVGLGLVGFPGRIHLAVAGILVGALALAPGSVLAVRPLTRPGHPVSILPELVPEGIMQQAGLDRRGRPL